MPESINAYMKTNNSTQSAQSGPLLIGLLSLALASWWWLAGIPVIAAEESPTAEKALEQLLDGNQRFVANAVKRPHQNLERRKELTKGQAPFAIILTCSDSRVSPEVIFDQGLGDLFVIRNAGNLVDDHTLGSLEYAVEHLHASLVVVMGHGKCGAVSAAVGGGHAPGHIHSVVESIEPAVEQSKDQPGDKIDNAIRANAKRMADIINRVEPILNEAVKAGKLKVVAACYDLDSGEVKIIK